MATLPEPQGEPTEAGLAESSLPGFVVLFCAGSGQHLGAWLPLSPGAPRLLGRGPSRASDTLVRVTPVRQTGAVMAPLGPFEIPSLSREQLELRATAHHAVEVVVKGQNRVRVNGLETTRAVVHPGDLLEVGSQLLLLCSERPLRLPPLPAQHPFGEPDLDGILGESPAVARLRQQLAFVAGRQGHVLLFGESGTGKELCARAIHRLSGRQGPLVARNAATLPDSLIDAELFGNVRGYPNPGMQERKGLIGSADRGTLFLDEFAELPLHQQTHLLRVMDEGEYQRLGEGVGRRVDLRVIGATNRPPSHLKHDLLARFSFQLTLDPLARRREDIPLLLRHLMRTLGRGDPSLARFLDEQGEPRFSLAFVRQMVTRPLPGNVRDLRNALWASALVSPDSTLGPLADEPVDEPLSVRPSLSRGLLSSAHPPSLPGISADDDQASSTPAALVQATLDRNNGSLEKTWRELGLSSRFALSRLIKKYGLSIHKHAR